VDPSSSNRQHKNNRPTWSVIISVITGVSVIALYIGIEYQRAHSMERSLKLHQNRIHEVEVWQRDWPRTGELNVDVRQNERLFNLSQRIEKCEVKLKNLEP